MYVRTYVCTYVRMYVRTYVHTYVCTYVHTYIRMYIHTYIHTYVRLCVHTYVHIYVHTYVHTYVSYVCGGQCVVILVDPSDHTSVEGFARPSYWSALHTTYRLSAIWVGECIGFGVLNEPPIHDEAWMGYGPIPHVRTYERTYVRTYVRMYVRTPSSISLFRPISAQWDPLRSHRQKNGVRFTCKELKVRVKKYMTHFESLA